MQEAMIFDALRTPRGKGKADGSLHEVNPVVLLAGGVESMSRIAMGSAPNPRDTYPALNFRLQPVPQGVSADLLATLDGHSRDDVDAFAAASQHKAAHARASGHFDKSIVPVKDMNGLTILAQDEFIRPDTITETLGKLKASFAQRGEFGFDALAQFKYPQVDRIRHVHTAGNSSGIVDGASLMLIGTEAKGRELGLVPRARVVSVGVVGAEPTIMLAGPAPATRIALRKAGLTIDAIDLFEVNEAFASVVLAWLKTTGADPEKVNYNGGAIALGHPLGCSGAKLITTCLNELERQNARFGLITMCIGHGMGTGTIIERLN